MSTLCRSSGALHCALLMSIQHRKTTLSDVSGSSLSFWLLQARLHAFVAAKAERRAASAALTQVEAGIQYHAQLKNFDKLREVASASSIATKVSATNPPFCRPQCALILPSTTSKSHGHPVGSAPITPWQHP